MTDLDPSKLRLQALAEDALDGAARRATIALLRQCFPAFFDDRPYFKQLPHWRLLARLDGELVGHVGVDHRVVRVGDVALRIFGLIDLCVAPQKRSSGISREMIRCVEERARLAEVPHLVLFADDDRLYARCGFRGIDADVRWLAIDDHRTLGIQEEQLSDTMMVKDLAGAPWPAGEVDMLGYLF